MKIEKNRAVQIVSLSVSIVSVYFFWVICIDKSKVILADTIDSCSDKKYCIFLSIKDSIQVILQIVKKNIQIDTFRT